MILPGAHLQGQTVMYDEKTCLTIFSLIHSSHSASVSADPALWLYVPYHFLAELKEVPIIKSLHTVPDISYQPKSDAADSCNKTKVRYLHHFPVCW